MTSSVLPSPYHVRLAISQYGEQFRAELFTEDLGDTEGDLLTELPPSIAEWIPYLAQGAELPPDAARQLGKDLFAALLGQPENAKKWSEVLAQAGRKGQPIRLLIDATTEAVRDLPYGLLCEPHDDWFLFRGGKRTSVEFVRILRRCSPRPLKLSDRVRVLIAVAEPQSADVPPFDASTRLQKLAAALYKEIDLIICGPDGPKPLREIAPNPEAANSALFTPYTKTTRDALRQALTGEFDVFHLLAHGHGAGVLLCKEDATPAETTASELAEWCGRGKTSLAFLQVCKAGQTGGRGGFGGVAQQLLNPRGGNLSAVVASTFPLDAEHSTDAAVGFYRQLAAGVPPEVALTTNRPETDWCWAFLELWARPGALGGTQQRAAFQFVSPYRGLSSFAEQDADLFFGRKAEVAELLQILRSEPAVAVVGDSGSGKTSLLQAGLVNAVRRDGIAGRNQWKILSLRPGYRPAQALIGAAFGGTKAGESMTTDLQTLQHLLKTALSANEQPLMVIFDQFEEIFTLARDSNEVELLTEALANAVEQQRDRFRLVIGMRSEFLGQAASIRELSRLIRRPWVLRPPGSDDMRDIVAGPAEHCGYTFQGPLNDGNPAHAVSLLDRILADPLLASDKGDTAAPLPLLQFALERLWLKAVEKSVTEFTHAEFDDVGGMGKAIAQHAEAVYQASATATGAGPASRALAEQMITALVSARGTRQPRIRDELQAETGNPDAARAVVDYLVGERLLTIRTDPEDITKSLVDLSHEVLILNWDRLRGWLSEDPQGRAMREEFRTAAEKWEAGVAGVPPRSWYGLPGADLANNYIAWIGSSNPRLSPTQQEFAQAMRDMLTRLRRRRRLVMVTLTVLTFASCALAIYADIQAQNARSSEVKANQNAQAATENAERATTEGNEAKRQKHDANVKAATLALEKGIAICEAGRPRLGILSITTALEICPPDATDLRRVILTNLAAWGPHLMCLDEVHSLPYPILATDPEGKYALLLLPSRVENLVHQVQLYDIDTEKAVGPPVATLWKDEKGIPRLAYQAFRAMVLPDGTALLTDGYSSVWNMKEGKQIGKEFYHGSVIATLSPNGKLVAATDGDDNVKIYNVATGSARKVTYPHQGKVYTMAFSSDSQRLATGCGHRSSAKSDIKIEKIGPDGHINEGFVHLYDITTTAKKHDPLWRRGMKNVVTCVKISPKDEVVTGGGFNLTSWQISDGKPIDTRSSPESTIHLAFDPANSTEFIACNPSGGLQILRHDETARLKAENLSPQGRVTGTGFRTDGRVFTANADGTVRIWRRPRRDGQSLTYGREIKPTNAEAILSLAFHPDGKVFAIGSKSGDVFLYDREGARLKSFRCPPGDLKFGIRRPVTDLRFSIDGTRIIAHDEDLNTFVFDTKGGPNPLAVPGKLIGVAPDGKTSIVHLPKATQEKGTHKIEIQDKTAVIQVKNEEYQIVEIGVQSLPTTPKMVIPGGVDDPSCEAGDGQLLRVSRVAFTPDGSVVALLDWDGAVHIFRTRTGEKVRDPIRHSKAKTDKIRALTFGPTGEMLLTRSEKSCGIWNVETGASTFMLSNPIGFQVMRFSPSGKIILGGTNFDMAQAWDRSGRELTPVPLVHAAQVWGVAANSNETRIITASFDRTARIWDRITGAPISPPLRHTQGVSDAIFSPDGKLALTGSWDGTARLWEVAEPLADEPERIKAWVRTMTGLRIGSDKRGELLKGDEWRASKAKLDQLGGPPITVDP